MGSTRLPGKVLRPLEGRSVLGWVVRAGVSSGELDEIVVATTTEPDDDEVVAECTRIGAAVYRGPVDDVLGRFVGTLAAHPADAFVRLTSDCPLLDPRIIRTVVRVGRVTPDVDYIGTHLPRTLPRGLDVEFVRTEAFLASAELATGHHRAHVTSYLYSEPAAARLLGVTLWPDRSRYRLTLDTVEDWQLISRVCEHFGDRTVPIDEVVGWLDQHPDVLSLNADVEQKRLDRG